MGNAPHSTNLRRIEKELAALEFSRYARLTIGALAAAIGFGSGSWGIAVGVIAVSWVVSYWSKTGPVVRNLREGKKGAQLAASQETQAISRRYRF